MKIAFIFFTLYLFNTISKTSNSNIHHTLDSLPYHRVALVLGTSQRVTGGGQNPYFFNRLEAAYTLYERGKVNKILLSGDNGTPYYNEPWDMKRQLIKMGVPSEDIVLDYAGFRTLDSVLRAKHVFGQNEMIIVSQRFHLQRALFIARSNGINATGFAAEDPPNVHYLEKREYLARLKAFLDIYILGTQPKFYGPNIDV